MKYKFVLILVILFVLLCLTQSAYATVTAFNGNFEMGNLANWTKLQNNGGIAYISNTGAYEGSYCGAIAAGTGVMSAGLSYYVPDCTGIVNISFWYKTNNTGAYFRVDLDRTAFYLPTSSQNILNKIGGCPTEWTYYTKTISATTGAGYIDFYKDNNGGSTLVQIDDLRINNVSVYQYIINGYINDYNNNILLKYVNVSLCNTENQPFKNTYTDVNGFYSFDVTNELAGFYNLHVFDLNGSYSEVYQTNIELPDMFTFINSKYVYTANFSLNPVTRQGILYTVDSVSGVTISPSKFYVYDYDLNNYGFKVDSFDGRLVFNFTFGHHYNVTGVADRYQNNTVYVWPYAGVFSGSIPLTYGENEFYYNIRGKVLTNDINPSSIVNAKVTFRLGYDNILKTVYSDGAGNYNLYIDQNLTGEIYYLIGEFSNYNETWLYVYVPSDFITSGTLVNNIYYLENVNIYLKKPSYNNTAYVNFFVTDAYTHPVPYADIVLYASNGTEYVYKCNNVGYLTTPNLPFDNYTFVVSGNGVSAYGSCTVNAANNGQWIKVVLNSVNPTPVPPGEPTYPPGYVTPIPTYNPSGYPTYVPTPTITPSGYPTAYPGTQTNNSTIIGLFDEQLNNYGISPDVKPIVTGFIITLICGLFGGGVAATVTKGESGNLIVVSAVGFLAVGFIVSTLLGFFPRWILLAFIIIIAGVLGFKYLGQKE
jgi:hypothetical protein